MASGNASAALALALVALAAPAAEARPARKGAGSLTTAAASSAPQASLEDVALMLSSSNPDELRMGIEASVTLGSPDAAPLLYERVRAGLPPDLLESALDAIVLIGDPNAGELLAALTRHRRPRVRLRAIQALAALKSRGAAEALSAALSDDAPQVREAAADGLGELGATQSLDRLYLAFDRGVATAARALGRLTPGEQVQRLVSYLGRVPLTTLTPALDALLDRRDVAESSKLMVVAQLEELGTAEARGYLEGLVQKLPLDTPPRVRRAIDDAIVRIAQ